jgi:hypothetical protein
MPLDMLMNMLSARVEIEEDVYTFHPPDNGAGPMWCHGNTCICRVGEDVFASGVETLPDAKPLHNCVPLLFQRSNHGWQRLFRDARRTREPSPLCCFPDGRLFLSLNPTLAPADAYEGPAEPLIAEFPPGTWKEPRVLRPEWEGSPGFTEHSYRSFAADGRRGELVLFQNVGDSHAEFAFLDAGGRWASHGRLVWPWGAEYEEPQPIRVCYPNVQLRDRAVYFCGVSDIVEPRSAWRAFKRNLTGREWDYDFRRLFFTWSDDIRTCAFHEWTEIASRDRTCGWIAPCDLYADDAGNVHLLWTERAIDERLREAFFPREEQRHCLHYAVIDRGVVVLRRLVASARGNEGIPGGARFQAATDGRLFALYHVSGAGNLVRQVAPDVGQPVAVPLQTPLEQFFTATVRGGSEPSDLMDVLGAAGNTIRYARIRLVERSTVVRNSPGS